MASTSSETPSLSLSSSSSSIPGSNYDVFLSFRGEDTRHSFTDHLYEAFRWRGIEAFRDSEKLQLGQEIASELIQAIKNSQYAIVVFSEKYADSRWCLDELAEIVECKRNKGLKEVVPVFYHVDPSDVRNQTGPFEKAFDEHQKNDRINREKIHKWKDAMREMGNLSGEHLLPHQRSEATVFQKIIQRISLELDHKFSIGFEHLVGMDSRVKEMLDFCTRERLDCVHFVGICGMGGIGKTTLALAIYGRIYSTFEAWCFLENVREDAESKGLVSLQNILLSKIFIGTEIIIHGFFEGINVISSRLCNKKVLIVLDDVNEEKQLKALAGNGDWFGPGSIIIVTSRDKHLLRRHGVKHIYEAKELDEYEALKLFSWKAFKKPHLEKNYVGLCMDFVRYANGLPLALEILGSSLFGRKLDAWRSARDKLVANPNRDIMKILFKFRWGTEFVEGIVLKMPEDKNERLSAKAFSKMKNLRFLKIGYVEPQQGHNRGHVQLPKGLIYLSNELCIIDWHGYPLKSMPTNFQPIKLVELRMHCSGIKKLWKGIMILNKLKLIDLSSSQELIEIPDLSGVLNLEKLILQNCTRLCKIHASVGDLKKLFQLDLNGCKNLVKLPENLGNLESLEELHVSGTAIELSLSFTLLKNLKKLSIGGCARRPGPMGMLMRTLSSLSSLTYLNLSYCNLQTVTDAIGCCLSSLNHLNLRGNKFDCLPKNIIRLSNLEILFLSDCKDLLLLSELPSNIKYLEAKGCTRLCKIYASVGDLKKLIQLDLNGCKSLSSFPNTICSLMSLKTLNLSDCSRLVKLPENFGNLEGLEELDLNGCKSLSSFANTICSLRSLQTLNLPYCPRLVKLPENFGNLEGLEELDVSRTAIRRLPSSVVLLKNLETLCLFGCDFLSSKPSNKLLNFLFWQMSPDRMGMLTRTLSSSSYLTDLNLSYCNLQTVPDVIGLYNLFLSGCKDLRLLPELPLNIKYFEANDCTLLETLPFRPEDVFSPHLFLINSVKLIENQSFGDMLSTMLARYIQSPYYLSYQNFIIPRSEIPKWFNHQSEGTSLNLQGPSDITGIAMCVVFAIRPHLSLHQPPSEIYSTTHNIGLSCNVNGYQIPEEEMLGVGLSEQFEDGTTFLYVQVTFHEHDQLYNPLRSSAAIDVQMELSPL
nr:TMV resistance protein N-like [Quercus suber]